MDIFTIGTSNYEVERLLDMLKVYNINCVVDIRATPYSKYNKQFDKENIKYTLTKNNFIYIYMGKELAAKRESKESYNSEGYCDFEKVIKEESFKNAIERLKVGCNKGYRIALLGAMQEPIRCQRGILVGRYLRDRGFNVKHIMHDYSLKNQNFIEECLLEKYFSHRMQLTLDSLLGNEKSIEDLIIESYRLANKDIGYRVENLK
ncbi:MAG: DUF488 family protein [Sarcina sp.]